MQSANDLRLGALPLRGAPVLASPPENENVAPDTADGVSWESAWIDLGGEG